MAKKDTQEEMEQENNSTENVASVGEQLAAKTAGSEVSEGMRARRGLTMKSLLPNQDWIMQNVVGGGKGTRATVGRIFGVVTSTDHRDNEVNGNTIHSIACIGMLNSESYVTGELSQASSVFFPMAYAEKIDALFKSDPTIKVIEVDCDIGLEATGKTIPYEWVVIAFREGEEMAVLKRIRNSRARPTSLLTAPDGSIKQLTAPAN